MQSKKKFAKQNIVYSKETVGNLYVLPKEIFCLIISFLSIRDIANLIKVNKTIQQLVDNAPITVPISSFNIENDPRQLKGSYKKIKPLLHNIHDIEKAMLHAHPDKKSKEEYTYYVSTNVAKAIGLSFAVCLMFAIARALLLENRIISKKQLSDTDTILIAFGFILLSVAASIFYLVKANPINLTDKETLTNELNEAIDGYIKKQS